MGKPRKVAEAESRSLQWHQGRRNRWSLWWALLWASWAGVVNWIAPDGEGWRAPHQELVAKGEDATDVTNAGSFQSKCVRCSSQVFLVVGVMCCVCVGSFDLTWTSFFVIFRPPPKERGLVLRFDAWRDVREWRSSKNAVERPSSGRMRTRDRSL